MAEPSDDDLVAVEEIRRRVLWLSMPIADHAYLTTLREFGGLQSYPQSHETA